MSATLSSLSEGWPASDCSRPPSSASIQIAQRSGRHVRSETGRCSEFDARVGAGRGHDQCSRGAAGFAWWPLGTGLRGFVEFALAAFY